MLALCARAARGDPALTLVPPEKAGLGVAIERVPDDGCPFPIERGEQTDCDGADRDVLAARSVGPFGRISVAVIRQTGGQQTAGQCKGRTIQLLAERRGQRVRWTLDVARGDVDWTVQRLAPVRAGKDRLLRLELEATGPRAPEARNVFVFGLTGDRMVERVAGDGTPVGMRIDYPGIDVCAREAAGSDTEFSVGKETQTAAFGKVSVHVAGQGPRDLLHTDSVFLVSEGPGAGSVIPIDQAMTSHSDAGTLAVRRLEEIRPGGRPFLWLEADLCGRTRERDDWSAESCDRRGYLLDRDAKGILRFRAFGVPLIDGGRSKSAGPALDVQFSDAHTLTISAKAQKLTAAQKKWLGPHSLP